MNKDITYDILQINNDINKDEIAFIIYSNVKKENEEKFYNSISELICRWLIKKDNIKLYVTDYSNDLLKLDNNISNTKVIYILDDNYEETLKLIKRDDYKRVYYTDEINNDSDTFINIYSYYEKKLSDTVNFRPYSENIYDYNDAEDFEIEEELFTNIEGIFAKESYKKSLLLGMYNIVNNELYSYEGFEYSIIKNNIRDYPNIIEVINDTFDTKVRYEDINDLKKDTLKDAIKEIYMDNYLELSFENESKLEEYLSVLESRLGRYIKSYLIIEQEEEETIINSFFVNMATYVIALENAILVISFGSNE